MQTFKLKFLAKYSYLQYLASRVVSSNELLDGRNGESFVLACPWVSCLHRGTTDNVFSLTMSRQFDFLGTGQGRAAHTTITTVAREYTTSG